MSQSGRDDTEITFGFTSHLPRPIEARVASPWELALIHRILEPDFSGRTDWLLQSVALTVVGECHDCPLVEFQVAADLTPILDETGELLTGLAPFAIQGRDRDGMGYQVVLFAHEGFIKELNTYRGDSSPFVELPSPLGGDVVRLSGADSR